jgi:hypothetical protein
MAEHESKQNPDNRNLISRRSALASTCAAAAVAVPAGVAVAATGEGRMAAIEAALVDNHNRWQRAWSEAGIHRCFDRRMALLEEAAALPIRSDADAASALLIAVRLGDHDDGDREVWINIGSPEDVARGNIVLAVRGYLAGRAMA